MKALISIILLTFSLTAGQDLQNLDSLMKSSTDQLKHNRMRVSVIPAERRGWARDSMGPPRSLMMVRNMEAQNAELEKRVRELEINTAKISVILENMQKVNENHTDRFEGIMKFIEFIITAIGAIITTIIGYLVKRKKDAGSHAKRSPR